MENKSKKIETVSTLGKFYSSYTSRDNTLFHNPHAITIVLKEEK